MEDDFSVQWARYACVCIKIDLQKTLLHKFELDGEFCNVEYEGLVLTQDLL